MQLCNADLSGFIHVSPLCNPLSVTRDATTGGKLGFGGCMEHALEELYWRASPALLLVASNARTLVHSIGVVVAVLRTWFPMHWPCTRYWVLL